MLYVQIVVQYYIHTYILYIQIYVLFILVNLYIKTMVGFDQVNHCYSICIELKLAESVHSGHLWICCVLVNLCITSSVGICHSF